MGHCFQYPSIEKVKVIGDGGLKRKEVQTERRGPFHKLWKHSKTESVESCRFVTGSIIANATYFRAIFL